MFLRQIEIRNFGVLRSAVFRGLRPLTVVVGPNGAGKTTLLDALAFVRAVLTLGVTAAVDQRGGLREIRSLGQDGRVAISLHLSDGGSAARKYAVELDEEDGRPYVHSEYLDQPASLRETHVAAIRIEDTSGTVAGADCPDESSMRQLQLSGRTNRDWDRPALATFGRPDFSPSMFEVFQFLTRLRVIDFDDAVVGVRGTTRSSRWVDAGAGNVANAARDLAERHPEIMERIVRAMQIRVPGMADVRPVLTEDRRVLLRFRDASFHDPFSPEAVSNGTLQLFALLVLLHAPDPGALLAFEEPERHLNPHFLPELVEDFRATASVRGQVLVTTHSPEFLNGCGPDEVQWLVKEKGFSRAVRIGGRRLVRDLHAAGDPLGRLWRQGIFEAALTR